MRRSLLNKRILPKPLRQALVLITLLLLPSAAWGVANSVTHTFASPVASTDPDYDYTVVSSGEYNWKIKNLNIDKSGYELKKSASTLGFSVYREANINQTATISFDLISDFGITGTVTGIDIVYNTGSGITGGKFDAGKVGDFIETIFPYEALPASTDANDLSKEVSVNSDTYNCYQFFKNDKIHLSFSFDANLALPENVFFNIKAIKIYTNTISVGGYTPNVETGAILGNRITAYDNKDGMTASVGYDEASHTLTLENAKINGYLYYSDDANLTIKIIGDNAFWTEDISDKFTLIQSTGTPNLTIQKQGDATTTNASLKLFSSFTGQGSAPNWDDVNLISGFNTSTELTVLESSYSNLPGYSQGGKLVAYTTLSLKVAGNSPTTKGTISGTGIEGSVSFDVSYNELTLDNANISGPIEWNNGSNDLTIKLKGKNSIIIDKGESAPVSVFQSESACSLKVEKLGTESATLKYASYGTIDGKTSDVASYFDNFILSTNTAFNQATSVIDGIRYNYLTTADTYDISVAGIQVHGIEGELGYMNNILNDTGESIVMFNGSNNTLTLKNATINGPIKSGISPLNVYLSGSSTMSGISSSSENKPFQYNGALDTKTLSFETTDAEAGELTMNGIHVDGTFSSAITNYTINQTFTNSSTVSDDWVYFSYYDSSEPAQQKIVINKNIDYHLSIGGQPVGKSNASTILGTTMSFTPADETTETPATLTLTGATISGGVEWKGSDNLTIALNGDENSITSSGYVISCTNVESTYPTLTFAMAEGATSCKLTLTSSTSGTIITGFSSSSYVTTGSGVYYIPGESSAIVTSRLSLEGSGTSSDPFLINNVTDLQTYASYVNNGVLKTEYVQLTDDIKCNGVTDFEPIGNNSYNYQGIFMGNNKTISNLSITTTSTEIPMALFGNFDGGTVQDLTLTSCIISGGSYVGAIAGFFQSGTIKDCNVNSCTIQCENAFGLYVGGIVGHVSLSSASTGIISGCIINGGSISGTSNYDEEPYSANVGGIVGYIYNDNEATLAISSCEVTDVAISSSNLTYPASYYIGGIAGDCNGSGITISNNVVNGTTKVSCEDNSTYTAYLYAGAIVGESGSETTFSKNVYYSTVETSTKKGSDALIKSGCEQRGFGDGEDIIGEVELAGTKSITTECFVEPMEGISKYYLWTYNEETDIYTVLSLPGENTVICIMPEENVDAKYIIKDPSTDTFIESTAEKVSSEGSSSYVKISFTMPDADLELSARTAAPAPSMTENQNYACFYSNEKDYDVPANMTAYIITGVKDGKVLITAVSYIKKGYAVLLEKDKTTEVENTTDFSDNILLYAESPIEADETINSLYVLYNNVFTKVTNGTSVEGACYLNLVEPVANTRGFYNIGGGEGTTSLREVKSEGVNSEKLADGEWYTLQGQRVAKPAKGLYILNGKKVVVK
jgi:hypothetical protein